MPDGVSLGSVVLIVLTAVLWGATDACMKYLAPPGQTSSSSLGSYFLSLVRSPAYLLCLAGNQAGSLLYYYSLATAPLSLVSPVVNTGKVLVNVSVADGMISSEVNTFSQQVQQEEAGLSTSSFVFSVPTSLREKDSYDLTVPRRSRSIPVGLDDSDDEDIEVPRFTSLDYEEFQCDSDGDLDLPRRHESLAERRLLLSHRMTSELREVGLQVWRGSLLLADYLLHHQQQLCDKTVLEVGSGTGLASIVASFCGARVIATDIKNCDIMDLIKRNCSNNQALIKQEISVKSLDFGDSLESEEYLEEVDTVIAGDIIYDNDITEKFVNFLKKFGQKSSRRVSVLVALEKRFVFTLADLDTRAPAFDFFMERLSGEKELMKYYEINLDFPQYFCYERSKEMIMIQIELST